MNNKVSYLVLHFIFFSASFFLEGERKVKRTITLLYIKWYFLILQQNVHTWEKKTIYLFLVLHIVKKLLLSQNISKTTYNNFYNLYIMQSFKLVFLYIKYRFFRESLMWRIKTHINSTFLLNYRIILEIPGTLLILLSCLAHSSILAWPSSK
jgi:hypothetical protein